MKKIIVSIVLLVFVAKIGLAQFHLEFVHNVGYDGVSDLVVLDDKMWLMDSPYLLYFDGSQWKQVFSYGEPYPSYMAGIKRADGSHLVVFNSDRKAYTWDEEDQLFDYVESPIRHERSIRIYNEDMIYVSTAHNRYYMTPGYLYLWDGQTDFTVLVDLYDTSIKDFYPINPSNVLVLCIKLVDEESSNFLARYNGDDLVDLHQFANLPSAPNGSSDLVKNITSIDANYFFILTHMGAIYLWDESSLSMSLVYTPDDYGLTNDPIYYNVYTSDNENLFLSGKGLIHINISSGTAQNVLAYNDGELYDYESLRSGSYDKDANRFLFASSRGDLFELDLITSTADTELQDMQAFKIFPNPSKDKVFLEFQTNQARVIKLYSLSGSLILSTESNQKQTSLNLDMLNKGVYLLKIYEGQSVTSRKLVVN